MKCREALEDPGGRNAKSGRISSGCGLNASQEKGFFADAILTSPLIDSGYHPTSLRKAEGIVLDKPSKPSYDTPSLLWLIVLLETLSNILGRLIANRLSA